MAKAARVNASLPDEIVLWEILLRLPVKLLVRCRSVCRAWRCLTSTRDFLLAHHCRQPSLPLFSGDDDFCVHHGNGLIVHYHDILAFDHQAATVDEQLHAVAQLEEAVFLKASCDGLLVLSKLHTIESTPCFSICNPATREHAPLGIPRDFNIMGMYSHRSTGEYRLLLRVCTKEYEESKYQIGCYVFTLGSNQPPRYIGWLEMTFGIFHLPVRVGDNLHWYLVYYPRIRDSSICEGKRVVVFDTISESFRLMRSPIVPSGSYIFEMDGTLGIHSRDYSLGIIYVWVLQNYDNEVWNMKYRIKLPIAQIREEYGCYPWDLSVVSVDSCVLLLVKLDKWLLHVDNDGKVVTNFHRRRGFSMSGCRLKQSLVQHAFFRDLEGYVVNASPFIRSGE